MHEPRLGANLLRHPIEESDDIMLGDGFDGIYRGDIDLG